MEAPPQAEMAMVVGKLRVPVERQVLTSPDGTIETFNMLVLGRRRGGVDCATDWLFRAVGLSRKGRCTRQAYSQLALVQEILVAVRSARHKRMRTGYFATPAGSLLIPKSMISLTVRGRTINVLNSTRPLAIDLGSSTDVLNWFVAEVWHDLRAVAPEPSDGEESSQDESHASRSEAEDDTQPAGSEPDADPQQPEGSEPAEDHELEQQTWQDNRDTVEAKVVETLRLTPGVKSASLFRSTGRFRVVLHERPDLLPQASLQHWQRVCGYKYKLTQKDLPGIESSLEEAAASLITKVGDILATVHEPIPSDDDVDLNEVPHGGA